MPLAVPIVVMIAGALITAWVGPGIASRMSNARLEDVILMLLVAVGTMLMVESFLPAATSALVPETLWPVAAFTLGIGIGIGLVSSLLGVAGGELIVPSFLFAFGVPVKVAGTASLVVSLPTVAVGIVRWARRGAFADRTALRDTVLPMAVGSVIGAVIGGLLVGVVAAEVLKLGLGVVLIVSAIRVFRHRSR